MATGTGLNVTKVNAYAVLAPKPGLNVSKALAYAVLAGPPVTPPTWPVFSFVDGFRTINYSQSFQANGTTPITVTVQSGSLPTGLSLSLVTGSTYKIAGTPSVIGTYSFTLRAVNTYGTVDQAFSIVINDANLGGFSIMNGSVVN
jgi:hypothetical protein